MDANRFHDKRQTSQSSPYSQEVAQSQFTSPRSHLLAATRIITKAGEISTHTKSALSAPIAQTCHTPQLKGILHGKAGETNTLPLSKRVVQSAADSTSRVLWSSRKKLKAAVTTIRMNAKHELLSHKLTARYLLPRNTVKKSSKRKEKRFVVVKDGVSGVLKPFAHEGQILVGKLMNCTLLQPSLTQSRSMLKTSHYLTKGVLFHALLTG